MAFNRGARLRAEGGELTALSAPLPRPGVLSLRAGELDALARLGPDAFERWAVRGWFEGA